MRDPRNLYPWRFPIVDDQGMATELFRNLINDLTRNIPYEGNGSPEGVLKAPQYSVYKRLDGSSGSILYMKKLTDIAGDTTQGWVAV